MPAEPLHDRWGSLLWRAWSAFGVSSWLRDPPDTVVDPEALVLATLAHDDYRLRDETVDWAIEHPHLLHPRRLTRIARIAGLEAEAATWLHHTRSVQGDHDSFVRSHKSTQRDGPISQGAVTAVLRLRALTGATARSEVVRALHAVLVGARGPMTSSEVLHEVALTRPHVLQALTDLQAAGLVRSSGSSRLRRWAPASGDPWSTAIWSPWRELRAAPWQDAVTISAQLERHRRAVRTNPTVATVVAGAAALDAAADRLRDVLGIDPPSVPTGAATRVGPAVADAIDVVLERLVSCLDVRPGDA